MKFPPKPAKLYSFLFYRVKNQEEINTIKEKFKNFGVFTDFSNQSYSKSYPILYINLKGRFGRMNVCSQWDADCELESDNGIFANNFDEIKRILIQHKHAIS